MSLDEGVVLMSVRGQQHFMSRYLAVVARMLLWLQPLVPRPVYHNHEDIQLDARYLAHLWDTAPASEGSHPAP